MKQDVAIVGDCEGIAVYSQLTKTINIFLQFVFLSHHFNVMFMRQCGCTSIHLYVRMLVCKSNYHEMDLETVNHECN